MVLTITKNDIQEFTTIVGTITFDDSYPTGGEAIAASDLGFTYLKDIGIFQSESGYTYAYDPSAGKIKAFYADYDAGADGALIEIPNASSLLDGEVVTFIATGIGEVDSDDF